MDGDLLDALTDGGGHLDGIKVHVNEDGIYIELDIYSSLQSSGMQPFIETSVLP